MIHTPLGHRQLTVPKHFFILPVSNPKRDLLAKITARYRNKAITEHMSDKPAGSVGHVGQIIYYYAQ